MYISSKWIVNVDHLTLWRDEGHGTRHIGVHVQHSRAARKEERVAQHVDRILYGGGRPLGRFDMHLVEGRIGTDAAVGAAHVGPHDE